MKKVMIIGVISLLGLSSCKKDWTCECTTTSPNVSNTAKSSYPITNKTKSSATTECDAWQTNSNSLSSLTGTNTTCVLK